MPPETPLPSFQSAGHRADCPYHPLTRKTSQAPLGFRAFFFVVTGQAERWIHFLDFAQPVAEYKILGQDGEQF